MNLARRTTRSYPAPQAQSGPRSAEREPGSAASSPGGHIRERLRTATAGRAFSGRAELRYINHFQRVLIYLLVIVLAWSNYAWMQHSNRLGDQQYIVFHDNGGATTAESVAQYRTGPSDEEIRHQAWEVIRWVLGAGSGNADTAFAEAAKLMTSQLKNEFSAEFGSHRGQLKELHIYKQLEDVKVMQLTAEMLPPGAREAPTRYDILVTGTLETYREGTQDKMATGPFAYRVHLVPLDRRTIENPYGILVSGISQVDMPAAKRPAADPRSPQEGSSMPKGDHTHF
ncbi:MAG: hypothetical protein ACREDR_18040 [Blastocatellia bacterium]